MVTTKAIVLSRKKVAESDVIINLLTRTEGKVRVYVNGARHPKSRFASATQPFNEGVFSLFINKELSRLSEVQISNPHMAIRADMNKIFLATYMLELVELAIERGQFIKGLYDKVAYALVALGETEHLQLLKVVYDLKIIAAIGYQPVLFSCCICGAENNLSSNLSVQHGGVVCHNCLSACSDCTAFTLEDLKWINIVLKKPFKTVQQLAVSDTMLLKIGTWTNRFIAAHVVRRPLKSLKLLSIL